jgi:predicted TIM-barrel fold metal-dependent hydrolase
MSEPLIVDIHTHVYPPAYIDMLRARNKVPYIHDPSDSGPPRLIILSSDDDSNIPLDQRGRPVDSSYSDIKVKLDFMDKHGIDCSVISLANPWLDFIGEEQASEWAQKINDDLESTCAQVNGAAASSNKISRLFAFGTLPLGATEQVAVADEVHRISTLPHIRGVIMGTTGRGHGLDDPELEAVWGALQDTQLMLFLHPHYGLPDEAFGGPEIVRRYGHVLPLALGFPLETTIAITRMYLSGVFDRFPKLRILLAHSGGTLPFLAGRIESCIVHERIFTVNGGSIPGPQRDIWDVLKTNIYLDAVTYGTAGLKAAVEAGGGSTDRLLFGKILSRFPTLVTFLILTILKVLIIHSSRL